MVNKRQIRGFIYKITNNINHKVYIGQTSNHYKRRWNEHKYYLNKGNHKNKHLQASWNKYGGDNFSFDVLEVVYGEDSLSEREIYYIEKFDSFKNNNKGYNLTSGGEHGVRNYKREYYVRYNNGSDAFRVLANGGDRQIIAEFKDKDKAIQLKEDLNDGKYSVDEFLRDKRKERELYKPQYKGNGVFYLRSKNKPYYGIFHSLDYELVEDYCSLINKWGFTEKEVESIVKSVKESDKKKLKILSGGRIFYKGSKIFQSTIPDLVEFVFNGLLYNKFDFEDINENNNYYFKKLMEGDDLIGSQKNIQKKF